MEPQSKKGAAKQNQAAARLEKSAFGQTPEGVKVDLYTLTNRNGLAAKVTNFGAIITELHVPDRSGKLADIVLGFDTLAPYIAKHPFFGATVGRVANRIANSRFTLEGKTYVLAANDGPNHLHGGLKGFDKKVWQAEPQRGAAVKFSYTSPDGEEAYPGTLQATVTMALTDANELRLDYEATTDAPTPVNLTNHSYFNLRGEGTVHDYQLLIAADHYTPSVGRIPTGEIRPVKGTPFDFTSPQSIGARFAAVGDTPAGYDNNFVLNSGGKELALAARAYEAQTGRVLETYTTQPGVQLYTANFLDGSITGKRGQVYRQHAAFCLETQHFADAVNHPNFPTTILRPGETYRQTTIYKFSVQ
jgi:aldose 1-epimerase